MKISHRWLQEFVALPASEWGSERVSKVLTDLGLEVEDVLDMSAVLDGFVVGHVVDRQPHPKADKLSVCTVDVGQGTPKTIVCGAANVAAGQTVPVALVGAVVPSAGFAIEERPLRGVTSQGMICSQAELGLGEDHAGIWVLDLDAAPGTPLAKALGVDDVIYDVAITPNRADCLSHLGIARDLAAFMRTGVCRTDVSAVPPHTDAAPEVKIEIRDAELCRRFMARRIDGVRIVESPTWLKDRLMSLGLRPRNVIVDVTNYVMHECGQPLHAYDARTITEATFLVQTAGQAGVKEYTTLDGKQRTLDADMLLICDSAGPVGIAGVMGGEHSEITDDTTSVLLESAWFAPSSVRRTAKVLGLSTDASYRFERGVDIDGVEWALDRATQLILELSGGEALNRVDAYPAPLVPASFDVRYERIRSIVGIDVSNDYITKVCQAIGCRVHRTDDAACNITAPTWRMDIAAEIDIAEEVMRLYGIDNVPSAEKAHIAIGASRLPANLRSGGQGGHYQRQHVRTTLCARGYIDCVTNVLGSPEDQHDGDGVTLANALGREFSVMRTSLVPSLLRVASRNLRHGALGVRLMEIGSVFQRDTATEFGIRQQEVLAVLIAGRQAAHWSQKGRPLDLYDLVSDVQAISSDIVMQATDEDVAMFTINTLRCMVGDRVVGYVGQVDPSVVAGCDIDVPVVAAVIDLRGLPGRQRRYAAVSAFPVVERDLALVVTDELRAGELTAAALGAGGPHIRTAEVFDVYRDKALGAGRKSLAMRMTFGASDRTLVDADVDAAIAAITAETGRRFGAVLRGQEQPLAETTSKESSSTGVTS
ncbi:MAG: phenylalanine--tRNA ligase subunit beta [Candidatus Kapabacteria bacterium]|nr:phenylalanine--tRNA ligase subunit beta [Candidatus Kapabacteria bacterium]